MTTFIGQAENPHIGAGVNVGVDLYTTKNVARLSRKMNKRSGNLVNDVPNYITQDNSGNLYVQDDSGTVYISSDDGESWNILAGNSVDGGKGITVWQDYLWAFSDDDVDLYGPLSGSGSWTNQWWTTVAGAPALQNATSINHVPLPSPIANAFMYVNNGQYIAQVQVLTFPFNPAGTPGTDFEALDQKFTMQSYYIAQCMGFLPTSSIAIAVRNRLNESQADIVIWDGVADASAINVVTVPGASGPVVNLVTRKGTLYATTTNEAGVYVVNGTSAELVDRLGLRMTNRTANGTQYTTRVQPNVVTGSCDFLGPELLVGTCNLPSPMTQPSGTGLYPYGVWATDVELGTVYTKYPLSHGDINAQYNTNYRTTFIKVIQNGKVIVGWGKGTTYGIDALDPSDYITDSNTVFIESELFEVGTRIDPETYDRIQYNLVEPLKTGEQIEFYYRTSQGEDYTLFKTDTPTTLGTNLGGIITPLPFQKVKYIQIGVRIKTGPGTPTQTPQLVSIYLI